MGQVENIDFSLGFYHRIPGGDDSPRVIRTDIK